MRGSRTETLPRYHPQTVLVEWGGGAHPGVGGFTIADALAGVCVTGGTGSGKTSGPGTRLALAYLRAGFGGLVLCAKKDERYHFEELARRTGRSADVMIFDAAGDTCFNFLEWEAEHAGAGAGLTINIVALLDEIAGALARGAGSAEGGVGDRFWADALHHLNLNLVDLPLFAGLPVSLPLLRAIVNSAPYSREEAQDRRWLASDTPCARILREASELIGDDKTAREDFSECHAYWTQEFPTLSERTRSVITLMFSMLARPFVTRPLRRLFSEKTTIRPELTFDGKIIIVDLPVQEYRLAGRIAQLAWKHCFQMAVLRRVPPHSRDSYLRPVFLWADEAQNFLVGEADTAYQAVARSSGGCSVFLFQNREILLSMLGNVATVDSLLGNLQTKFFCQNSSPDTNQWASELLGARFTTIMATTFGRSGQLGLYGGDHRSANVQRSEDRRHFVEPARFTTLKRGGAEANFEVESIVYAGGKLFEGEGREPVPYTLMRFSQR